MEKENIFGVCLKNQSLLVNQHCLSKMKINLTAAQWRDIQICLLEAIRNSAKDGKKPDLDCFINKRYLQTHDLIEMNLPVKL